MAIYTYSARILVDGTIDAPSQDAAEELLVESLYAENWSGDVDISWSDTIVDELEYDFDANEPDYDENEDVDDLSDHYAVSDDQPVLF